MRSNSQLILIIFSSSFLIFIFFHDIFFSSFVIYFLMHMSFQNVFYYIYLKLNMILIHYRFILNFVFQEECQRSCNYIHGVCLCMVHLDCSNLDAHLGKQTQINIAFQPFEKYLHCWYNHDVCNLLLSNQVFLSFFCI